MTYSSKHCAEVLKMLMQNHRLMLWLCIGCEIRQELNEGLRPPEPTFLGSMLNFFFPFENSLLFSVILLRGEATENKNKTCS